MHTAKGVRVLISRTQFNVLVYTSPLTWPPGSRYRGDFSSPNVPHPPLTSHSTPSPHRPRKELCRCLSPSVSFVPDEIAENDAVGVLVFLASFSHCAVRGVHPCCHADPRSICIYPRKRVIDQREIYNHVILIAHGKGSLIVIISALASRLNYADTLSRENYILRGRGGPPTSCIRVTYTRWLRK